MIFSRMRPLAGEDLGVHLVGGDLDQLLTLLDEIASVVPLEHELPR